MVMLSQKISDIIVPQKRLRVLNLKKVQELAESIKTNGLINPISIHETDGILTLIAGLHRLEACKSLGLEEIDCLVRSCAGFRSELLEIDENLIRQELTVLEQSEHIARREEILEALGLRTPNHRPPQTLPIIEAIEGEEGLTVSPLKTTQELASEIGLSEASFKNRKQIAKSIEPEVKKTLRDTEIANSTRQLLEVARMEPEQQKEFAKAVSSGQVESVKEFKATPPQPKGNFFTGLEKSSKTDEHYTPQKITDFLYKFCPEFDLDPCSDSNKNIKAKRHYTQEDNGLAKSWNGRVFVNPPFSDVSDWVKKALDEYRKQNCDEVIFLSKFDSRVGWFKPLAQNFSPLCVVEGYVSYHGNDGDAATFSTALWYLGDRRNLFIRIFSDLGWLFQVLSYKEGESDDEI